MKISTKGRYALRMLIDLATNSDQNYIALKDVAERQNISKKYLEQIVPSLHKAGFVETTRGFLGGYRLAKKPEECIIGEILRITEGNLAPVVCLQDKTNKCARAKDCVTLPIWEGLQKVILDYLDGLTLQNLIDNMAKK